ncbi:hypothetical protein GCM10010080_19370 [Thermomonas carbonis]|uniref:Acyltransferase n=1 Tax=Thermomonas carbonis TaxID=1463158 RepID=A0A7G9SN37_9GAMM|nr:acyltransferase [Thermomonas carbonis]QNN69262.1 acyltransferase [Thermomonas carbonis]GHC05635.1 hypothetical protein GCM10010080_19370 [Thermomonas carbonis]
MRLSVKTWLRGLAMLRHPILIADLGQRLQHLRRISLLRADNPGATIKADLILLGNDISRIRLGAGCILGGGAVLACGDDQDGLGRIVIDEGTYIGQYNNLRAGGGDIRIGKNCLVSQFCTLVASNHAHVRGQPIIQQGNDTRRVGIVIGDDVWLGAGCVILPGVVVGDGAIIGANAVVTTDVPPNEIWGGVPAQKISERM